MTLIYIGAQLDCRSIHRTSLEALALLTRKIKYSENPRRCNIDFSADTYRRARL